MASVFTELFSLAMLTECEKILGAGDTEPQYTLDREGVRQTILSAIFRTRTALQSCRHAGRGWNIYQKVSTRDAEAAIKEIGIEGLVSTQVSRTTKLLDD